MPDQENIMYAIERTQSSSHAVRSRRALQDELDTLLLKVPEIADLAREHNGVLTLRCSPEEAVMANRIRELEHELSL
jgi:plasmid stabilization system protein ParE